MSKMQKISIYMSIILQKKKNLKGKLKKEMKQERGRASVIIRTYTLGTKAWK